MIRKPSLPTSVRSENSDAGLETADTFDIIHQQERSSSKTALQLLRIELDGLKGQKEQALQTSDRKIVAMGSASRVMEQLLQDSIATK